MDLSPTERQTVLKMIAQLALEELKAEAGGDLAGLVIMPLNAAAHMLHKSTKQLPLLIPITDIGPNSKGVTFRHLMNHIEENTRYPEGYVAPVKQSA